MLSPCMAQPARAAVRQSLAKAVTPSFLPGGQLPNSRHHQSFTSLASTSTITTRRLRQPQTLQNRQQNRPLHQTIPRPHDQPSSSSPSTPPSTTPQSSSPSGTPLRPSDRPTYELRFTCNPCGHRSTHFISKQGYHHGSVLVSCPSCRNRHVISDHLQIFGDRRVTIEDILKERGQLVKRGTLGEDGNVEFWEDGTTTERRGELSDEEKIREKERLSKKGVDDGQVPGSSFKSVKPGEEEGGKGKE